MKLAIHHRKDSFSDRWISYCEKNHIDFKLVNCYDNNIITQLKDCDALLWHFHHHNYKDSIFAKGLFFSLEQSGMKVFPDFNTAWHFDDKIGQKYLLETLGMPLVPTFVFYDKSTAIDWARKTTFPKVFKLSGGAGGQNVRLIKNYNDCERIISKCFSNGFSQNDPWYRLKDRFNKFKHGKASLKELLIGFLKIFIKNDFEKLSTKEKGYAYFQEFIPNNTFDIRVVVVGNKAFGLKRNTRPNDFRASGSGSIIYDSRAIDIRCVEMAFKVNEKIKSQSIAFDFVFDKNDNPLIIEISYGYSVVAYDDCPGYWLSDLTWIDDSFKPQEWMIENLIKSINA
ncbi:hypothetical protein I5168_11140 [Nonlabens sp. SCSIO 43208]|uniref:ATP-grasp domain-containing protein n=1 Tax=Nonlabens sp. SCSIO 43208 TaxID=2793009 RepID=UPI003D6BD2A7